VARAGPEAGRAVAGIGELATIEREAAATDALREPVLQPFELGDAFVDSFRPPPREPGPVAPVRSAVGRELAELRRDLVERQADALSEDDERDLP